MSIITEAAGTVKSLIQKYSKIQSGSKMNQEFQKESIDSISDKIVSIYGNNLNKIIMTSEPSPTEVYMLLIFNCNIRFYHLFHNQIQTTKTDINTVAYSLNDFSLNNTILSEYNDNSYVMPTEQSVIDHLSDTMNFRKLIENIFAEIEKTNEQLIETILNKFAEFNSKKLKESQPKYYRECSRMYGIINPYADREKYLPYYEFHYEDFLIIFCSIVHHFTGLNIRLEFSDRFSLKLLMKIYGNEKTYNKLIESTDLDLQLKPYALKYEIFVNKMKHNNNKSPPSLLKNTNQELRTPLMNQRIEKKILQFNDLNINNPLHFPPYFPYNKDKEIKYRRYNLNDDYHECDIDPEFTNKPIWNVCDKCSKFRNIDKLRIIYKSLEHLFKYNSLYTNNLVSLLLFQRNHISYSHNIKTPTLFYDNLMIFYEKNVSHLIYVIRNYYGEYFSFYYLWVAYFCKWMIFPSILGLISFIVTHSKQPELDTEVETFQNYKLNYYDISSIVLCGIITLWATLYLKSWKRQEKLFNYIWGMENYHKNEPINETFISYRKVPFAFGETIKTDNAFHWLRKTTSMLIVCIIIMIRVWVMIKLFNLKESKTPSIGRDITVACIQALIIKIMSMIYESIARRFSQWENHKKYSQQQNSLAFKLIMFEFFNNYSNLFYIAFYKPNRKEKCLFENCYKELEVQLYILLVINFSFNFYEIGWPWLRYKSRLRESVCRPPIHSIDHQLICEGYNTLIYEYNERMINFGFVCLFTVAAPFTPAIVLIFTFLENFFDLYKMFNLLRIETIEGSSGIGIYNFVLKSLYFIGMLTSVALVLFANPRLLIIKEYLEESLLSNNDFINKIMIFAFVENAIIIMMWVVRYNDGPLWFENLEELKLIYENKYFNKKKEKLPHKSYEK